MTLKFLEDIDQLQENDVFEEGCLLDSDDESQASLEKAAKRHYTTGVKHERNGRISSAIQSYTTALMLDNNHALACYSRGVLNVSYSSPYTNFDRGLKDLYAAQNLFFEQMNFEHYRRTQLMLNFVLWTNSGVTLLPSVVEGGAEGTVVS